MTAGMRLCGAGLLAISGALLGLRKKTELLREKRTIDQITDALRLMESELSVLQTPLPQLLDKLRDCRFFLFVSAGFGGEPLELLWARAAMAQPISGEARRILAQLGKSIGRYDAARQCAEIAVARQRLTECSTALGTEFLQRGRLFPGLGAALGAILAAMLF